VSTFIIKLQKSINRQKPAYISTTTQTSNKNNQIVICSEGTKMLYHMDAIDKP